MDALSYIGLSEQKATETLKNVQLTEFIKEVVKLAQNSGAPELSKFQGNLLYQLCTRIKPQCRVHAPMVVKHICNGNIRSEAQLSAALDYLLHHTAKGTCSEPEFMQECGAGVEVSDDQIEDTVSAVMLQHKDSLLTQRYSYNMGKILGEVKKELKWADGSKLKREVDLQVLELLGPKTAAELVPSKKTKTKPAASESKSRNDKSKDKQETAINQNGEPKMADEFSEGARTIEELMRKKVHFHKVGENYKTEGYVTTSNTMRLIAEHLKKTGGKVITRFPPEPNGILHIGHAKAININFGYAKAFNGECNLRYDDTNPEKEEERFFVGIKDIVEWLGYKPTRITHSSDNFDQLYKWAVELIKSGHAYVCHQTSEDTKGYDATASPWRDRPVEESLLLFEAMRRGKFDEGDATLRLKLTLEEGKMDPIAYRIKYCAHPRTGNKWSVQKIEWCIYPTYDYTHCLCDSIENITHSMCTKEFQSRRSSYYWLCNAVDIYCPVQWEYGRLNMNYTVVSKRKINKLITEGIVRDWDDPRLYTLSALRRRGFPAEAINTFVARMGVTGALVTVDPQMLDAHVRDVLNTTAPRAMACLRPIRVSLTNWSADLPRTAVVPNYPAEPDRGSHNVPFSHTIYIDADDFREKSDKNYKRFASDQAVGLKHIGLVLTCVAVHKNSSGEVSSLDASVSVLSAENKPKGFIQWVADPIQCEVRLYDRLFAHKNPEDTTLVPDGFLSDCNPHSLQVLHTALVDRSVSDARVYDRFQFERIGYFCVDQDSRPNQLVFNRTLLLKEDATKNT